MIDAERFLSIARKMPSTNYVLTSCNESDAFMKALSEQASIHNLPFVTVDFAMFETATAAMQSEKGKEVQILLGSEDNAYICYFKDADILADGCSTVYWLRTVLEKERYTANQAITIFKMADDSIKRVFSDPSAPFYNSHFRL